uniref:Uncharacterized protein n=1 Tax=Anguilla anguilla TaxID=7936 RepID=A0A0E9R6E3_ANGAN
MLDPQSFERPRADRKVTPDLRCICICLL